MTPWSVLCFLSTKASILANLQIHRTDKFLVLTVFFYLHPNFIPFTPIQLKSMETIGIYAQLLCTSHCRHSPGTMTIELNSTEAPSGLTPSWRHQRDPLYQLRPVSQSPISPTSSSCLLSPQSLGATLPRIPGDIPHPHPMTILGRIHKSHAPRLPLRPFCRFLPVVLQPLPSSPTALPVFFSTSFQAFLSKSFLLKFPTCFSLPESVYGEFYPKQLMLLTLGKTNSNKNFRD